MNGIVLKVPFIILLLLLLLLARYTCISNLKYRGFELTSMLPRYMFCINLENDR